MTSPQRPASGGQRRVFLVKKRLQLKLVLMVLGAVAAAVFLIGFDVYRAVGGDIVRDLMDPGLHELFLRAAWVTAVKMGFYLLGVAFLAALLSNKMAGPVYRFERAARTVAAGDLTHRVSLRKGDELTELQDAFNDMLSAVHKRVSDDAALAQRLSRRIDELSRDGGLTLEAGKKLKDLKTEVDRIASGFKI